MKWLKEIFQRGSGRAGPLCLQISEVRDWLIENTADPAFDKRLQEIYRGIEATRASLQEELSALERAEADESTPPKLLRAGLAARSELSKQLSTLAFKLSAPKRCDLDSATEHHWSALKGLERTATTFSKAQRYVAALFPKNIERINRELAAISRILLDLENLIKERRKASEERWYCEELASKLMNGIKRGDELNGRLALDEAKEKKAGERIAGLLEEAGRHAKSEQAKDVEEARRELEKAKQKRADVVEELTLLIAPLTKALGRIAKQGSRESISLKHDLVFEKLLKSPESVSDPEISGSLEELNSHLAALGLKDRKKEKILDHIQLLIRERSLERARARQVELDVRIIELEGRIREGSHEQKRLKEETAFEKKAAKELHSAMDQCKDEFASLSQKMGSWEEEINERLSGIAGRPVKVALRPEGDCEGERKREGERKGEGSGEGKRDGEGEGKGERAQK